MMGEQFTQKFNNKNPRETALRREGDKMIAFILSAVIVGSLAFVIWESFKAPKERTIQVITRFRKFHTVIMSVNGYRLNNPHRERFYKEELAVLSPTGEVKTPAREAWDIIPDTGYKRSWSEKLNIYFFLWPIYQTYVYPFSYLKLKKKGDLQPGDNVVWSNEKTGEALVSRTGTSNHIEFQSEYPTITGDLFTQEMAEVLVFTDVTIQAVNPVKMMFRITNWLGVTTETIGGALRGIVGRFTIPELNKVRSEGPESTTTKTSTADFTEAMTYINYASSAGQDGIVEKWGAKLTKCIFKAFSPASEQARTLINSFTQPEIAEQEGKARVIAANRDAEVVNIAAKAEKERRITVGLAEVDDKGNIVQQKPNPNDRVWAEAVRETKLGTLVFGESRVQPVLDIGRPITTPKTTTEEKGGKKE